MTITIRDSFTEASPGTNLLSHTGEVGATWTRHPASSGSGANWVTSDSGRAYCPLVNSYTAAGAAFYLASGSAPADDHDVSVIWHYLTHPEDTLEGIVFRYHGTVDNGYRLGYVSYTIFRYWRLEKITGGTATDVGNTTYAQSLASDTDTAILIQCRGSGITVQFDGVTRITSTDTTYLGATQRRAGLWASGSGTGSNTTGYHAAQFVVADVGEAVVSDAAVAASAHRTASVAGNWSDAATWGGQSPPGVGGDAMINVAVVLDTDVTVGTSGAAGTAAVTIAATGSLTFATGRTLRCRGDMIVSGAESMSPLSNVRLSLVAGCSLIFDATLAPGVRYRLQVGTAHGQTPLVRVRGTSGSRATIRSDLTGGALPACFLDGQLINQGSIDAEYLDLTDFGDATHLAWAPYLGGSDNNYVRLDHTTLTRCGDIQGVSALTGGGTFILNQTRFVNSAGPNCLWISAGTAITSGARSFTYTCFDKRIVLYGPKSFTIHHCVFEDVWNNTPEVWADFHSNFFQDRQQPGFSVLGDVTDCYYLEDSNDGNPHGFSCPLDMDVAYRGVVIESVTGGGGDLMFPSNPASPRITTFENCLLIPSVGLDPAYGASPGKLVSMLGGVNTTAIVRHCTYVVNDQESGVQTGESYQGHVGMLADFSSNLAWTPPGMPPGWKYFRVSTAFQDALRAADADYNWGWNLMAGTASKGYHATNTTTPLFSTGTPGVHDGDGNPGFVDAGRNLAKWATVVLGSVAGTAAGKRADAIAALRADPSRIDELIAYVRGGFAPTNVAMTGAAKDAAAPTTAAGGTPGAVAMAGAAAATSTLYVYDTFTDADGTDLLDHVGQLGATWTRHPAADQSGAYGWRLASDRALCYAGGYHPALDVASGVPASAQYDVVAVWRFLTHLGDAQHGIAFGYDPTANTGYRLVYESYVSYRRWTLQSVLNGLPTTLGTPYSQVLTAGADTVVVVQVRSTGIAVLIGGVSRITSADTTYGGASRRVGLYGQGDQGATPTTGMHLGYLAVTAADADLPDFDLAGPATGVPGLTSFPFRVTLAPGVNPGTTTITPTAAGMAGTFAPPTLTLTDATRTGTFTFTPAGTTEGTGTIGVEDDVGLAAPPRIGYATAYGPVPGLASWRSRVGYTHAGGANPFVPGSAMALELGGHYDPVRCVMLADAYCKRTSLPPTDWSAELGYVTVDYRDNVILDLSRGGLPPWHHRYTTGLSEHYRNTGNPLDRQAIDAILPGAGPGGLNNNDPASYINEYKTSSHARPATYQLLAAMDREWAGMGDHPLTDAIATAIVGYIDEWEHPRYITSMKAFMVGLSIRAVLAYWDRFRDSTDPARAAIVKAIPDFVLRTLELLWTMCWWPPDDANPDWTHGAVKYQVPPGAIRPRIVGLAVQTAASNSVFTGPASLPATDDWFRGTFLYFTTGTGTAGEYLVSAYVGATRQFTIDPYSLPPSIAPGDLFDLDPKLDPDGDGPSPIVNPMAAPAFAWAYWYVKRVLGDAAGAVVHRGRFDAMAYGQTMVWESLFNQKQWNQVFWWYTMGLDWRARGDGEWSDAGTYALQAPATGASGAHSVASGPFRLSWPYGVKRDAPVHVAPASSSGRGTFAPATAVLTADRPTAMFTFTPAAADNGSVLSISATPAAPTYAGPLTITAGGLYTGNWESQDPNVPAVTVATSEPVVIFGATIRSKCDLIRVTGAHAHVTVRGTRGYGLNPNVAGKTAGRFLTADGFDNVTVERCYLESTAGIYLLNYAGDDTPAETVRIVGNRAKNIDGRKSDGAGGYLTYNSRTPLAGGATQDGFVPVQFLQLDKVIAVPGMEVAWNEVINEPYVSRVEDNINIFLSSGTPASPLLIHDNYIQGAYTINPAQGNTSDATYSYDWDFSGGGILLGDGYSAANPARDPAYVRAYNNQVVSTTNYGIAISAGHDNDFSDNRILSSDLLPDGVTRIYGENSGAYIWNLYNAPPDRFYNNTGSNNAIAWSQQSGRQDYWMPDDAAWVAPLSISGPVTRAMELAELASWTTKLAASGQGAAPALAAPAAVAYTVGTPSTARIRRFGPRFGSPLFHSSLVR